MAIKDLDINEKASTFVGKLGENERTYMKLTRTVFIGSLLILSALNLSAQEDGKLTSGMELGVEVSGTAASGDYAPLWLTGNKYGLSSIENWSNYERVSLMRTSDNDSLRNWRRGYGVDLAFTFNSARTFVVQQAFVEFGFKKANLIIGSQEHPILLRNQALTSGGLSLGINARPIPQIRLDFDYFTFPGTKGWWKWKLWASYGVLTDGKWQKKFAEETYDRVTRYTDNTMYHEKALYWKFGKEDCDVPLTFDIGLQIATQFAGKTHNVNVQPGVDQKHPSGFSAYMDALLCSGSDSYDGAYANTAGNHVGSYNMALTWHGDGWKVRGYFERLFEDQSMLTVQYGIQDHLVGLEAELPKNPVLTGVVVEHLSTYTQTGAVYHDEATGLPDKMNGRDDYYNHKMYSGWQFYGFGMGHPFLTSPIYNDGNSREHMGKLEFYNNRVKAWHVGLSGNPSDEVGYRVLMSFTRNWGTYVYPFQDMTKQQYLLAEANYKPHWAKNWSGTLGISYDHGDLLGNSFGGQLTLRKTFNLF